MATNEKRGPFNPETTLRGGKVVTPIPDFRKEPHGSKTDYPPTKPWTRQPPSKW